MDKPRVIFANRVYWPDESATAQLLSDLAPALVQRGREVHVIAGGCGPAEHAGVTVHRTGGDNSVRGLRSRVASYWSYLRAARRLISRLARPGDCVVIKTDPPMLAAALTGRALAQGARVVQWVQDIYPEIAWQHAGAAWKPFLLPLRCARDRAWRASAFCVPVGEDMAGLVRGRGVAPERVRVLPNWAPREMETLPSRPEVEALRSASGWDGKFVAAYSGNLGRVHEFATVLGAAAQLRDRSEFRFVFIGTGARHGEVAAAVHHDGLENVQLLPARPRTQLAASLGSVDAHVVTLLPGFESLVHPSKVAGALAAGKPIAFVGPLQSALAGFLRAEGCGAVFAPGEAQALAATLSEWRAQPERHAALARAARAAYEKHFRFAHVLAAWKRLLDEAGGGDRNDIASPSAGALS